MDSSRQNILLAIRQALDSDLPMSPERQMQQLTYWQDQLDAAARAPDRLSIDDMIALMRTYRQRTRHHVMRTCSVSVLDSLWSRDDGYIPRNIMQKGQWYERTKYLRSRCNLYRGMVNSPTILGGCVLNESHPLESTIIVSDGRHRFCNLRDMGADQLPVMILKTEESKIRQVPGLIVDQLRRSKRKRPD
jgi:hypothetical protein